MEAISYYNKISILKVYTHGKADEVPLPETKTSRRKYQ